MAIKKLVVLMLENRSFDSVLGFLRPKSPEWDGLTGEETQRFDLDDPTSATKIIRTRGIDGYVTRPDAPHELVDVLFHLFGSSDPAVPDNAVATNAGFLARFASTAPGAPLSPAVAHQAIRCFDTREQLPAIAALANTFTVCDRWFSSMPGPTWPNRWFAHCATAGGCWESPGDTSPVWNSIGESAFDMPTVFERLSQREVPWNIYYGDIPQALSLATLHKRRNNFVPFAAFLTAARYGTLPAYSFIEPSYFDVPVLGHEATDMHPAHDAQRGDQLIADVYNALRANEDQWSQVGLLITWDEHGGFYDHVPPPATVSPDADSMAAAFKFRRLGVRVPAIVASAYTPASVDHTVYDHASIPATVRRLFGPFDPLSDRDRAAATFDRLFTGPARESPLAIRGALDHHGAAAFTMHGNDMTGSQRSLVSLAAWLRVPGVAPPTTIEGALLHVSRYLQT